MWGKEEQPAILPKAKGNGIMVSDIVEEHDGYLRLTDEEFKRPKRKNCNLVQEAREMLEYGADKQGYWTS